MANTLKRWDGSQWTTVFDSTSFNPTGTIIMYAVATAPTGYLLCDGSAVSRTTYAALFALIGTTYGVGNGTTTFNVPDLRGRAPIGVGTGTGLTVRAIAGTVGVETYALTSGESGIVAHNHSITDPTHTHSHSDPGHVHAPSGGGTSNGDLWGFGGGGLGGWGVPADTASNNNIYHQGNTGGNVTGISNVGNSTGITGTNNVAAANAVSAHQNMQPSIVLNFVIKT